MKGERFVCSVATTPRFSRLKAIANEVASFFLAKDQSVALVRRILHKKMLQKESENPSSAYNRDVTRRSNGSIP